MRKITLLLIIFLLSFPAFSFAAKQIYFSDKPNPPETRREPPFESTRKQIKKEFYYLNIRYPRQGTNPADAAALSMKFSVGNECDDMIVFQVARLKVSAKGKPVKILPVFYNENAGIVEKGWGALQKYSQPVPSHEHRTVEVFFLPESLNSKELLLEIAVLVTSPSKKDMAKQEIQLYRGYYS